MGNHRNLRNIGFWSVALSLTTHDRIVLPWKMPAVPLSPRDSLIQKIQVPESAMALKKRKRYDFPCFFLPTASPEIARPATKAGRGSGDRVGDATGERLPDRVISVSGITVTVVDQSL